MSYKITPPVVADKLLNEKEPTVQQRMKQLVREYPVYEDFLRVSTVREAIAVLFSAYPEDRIRQLGGDRAAFLWLQTQVRE
jgi:hypothetical protein